MLFATKFVCCLHTIKKQQESSCGCKRQCADQSSPLHTQVVGQDGRVMGVVEHTVSGIQLHPMQTVCDTNALQVSCACSKISSIGARAKHAMTDLQ